MKYSYSPYLIFVASWLLLSCQGREDSTHPAPQENRLPKSLSVLQIDSLSVRFDATYPFTSDRIAAAKSILSDIWMAAQVHPNAKSFSLEINFQGRNKYGEDAKQFAFFFYVNDLDEVRRFKSAAYYAEDFPTREDLDSKLEDFILFNAIMNQSG